MRPRSSFSCGSFQNSTATAAAATAATATAATATDSLTANQSIDVESWPLSLVFAGFGGVVVVVVVDYVEVVRRSECAVFDAQSKTMLIPC